MSPLSKRGDVRALQIVRQNAIRLTVALAVQDVRAQRGGIELRGDGRQIEDRRWQAARSDVADLRFERKFSRISCVSRWMFCRPCRGSSHFTVGCFLSDLRSLSGHPWFN